MKKSSTAILLIILALAVAVAVAATGPCTPRRAEVTEP